MSGGLLVFTAGRTGVLGASAPLAGLVKSTLPRVIQRVRPVGSADRRLID